MVKLMPKPRITSRQAMDQKVDASSSWASSRKAAKRTAPSAANCRGPTRSTSRPLKGDTTKRPRPLGIVPRAGHSAEYPSVLTMNSTSSSRPPPMPTAPTIIINVEAVKGLMRKRARSSMGRSARRSHHTKEPLSTTAATSRPITGPEPQPQPSPWMMARIRQPMAAPERRMPGRSTPAPGRRAAVRGPQPGQRDGHDPDGHVHEEDPVPRRILDQHSPDGRANDGGERARRAPETGGQTVLARGKALSRMMRETGTIPAAPIAWPMRKTMSHSTLGESPQAREDREDGQ